MRLIALLPRCLLVLALLVNGLPAMASPVTTVDAAEAADCHALSESDESAGVSEGADCCDGGTCACSCLHHAPVAPALVLRLEHLRPREPAVPGLPTAHREPAHSPSLRPPIA